eukprot:SAG22_NODE_355_length_11775_cov_76.400651_13_plen_114_part_00
MWQDGRGRFHAIFHWLAASHAFSRDALHWQMSPEYAFTPRVNHTDGSATRYVSRERVKLAIDPVTKAPIAVFSAVRAPWLDPRCKKVGVGSAARWDVLAPFCDASFTHMQSIA